MRDMVCAEDLALINKALAEEADVKIQNTGDGGYRIISCKPKVLKRSQKRQVRTQVPEYPKI